MVAGWKTSKLGEIADVTKLAGFEFTAHIVYSDSGKIIALRGLNVKKGRLDLTEVKYIDKSNFSKLARSKLFVNDMLFTYVGTIGEIALVDIDDKYYLAPNVSRIRFTFEQIYPKFALYLMQSRVFKNEVITPLIASTTQQALSMENIRKFDISFPSLSEQRRIAEVLSDTDALILALEKLIDKKRAIKQGAMQELLTGRRRLDGFSGEWTTKPLLECCDLLQGLTYSPNNVQSHGLLVLRSSNIQGGLLAFDNCVYVDCIVDEMKYVKPKDILICVRNGSSALIGKSCVIDKAYNATFGAFMSVLRGDTTGYIAHIFGSDVVQQQIRNRSNATINQITKRDFEEIKIPVPYCEEEQIAIASILSDMDAEIDALNTKLDKLRNIKQGMMSELLTGRIRLLEEV